VRSKGNHKACKYFGLTIFSNETNKCSTVFFFGWFLVFSLWLRGAPRGGSATNRKKEVIQEPVPWKVKTTNLRLVFRILVFGLQRDQLDRL
jgi:hypothetical protein